MTERNNGLHATFYQAEYDYSAGTNDEFMTYEEIDKLLTSKIK